MVEDNADDELLLMRLLQPSKWDQYVVIVRDGKKALDYLTHHDTKIDDLVVIFLDLNIPAIRGLELLAMIRDNERLSHLPVIVMTSSNSPQDLKECNRLGVRSYVEKPLSLVTFTKAVADVFHLPGRGEGFSPKPA